MGACGPRIRIVTGCPGVATCRWGVIDTKKIAHYLDHTWFREETPHKFKMAVTGCPHNCAKATENDIGIMGGIIPHWDESACNDCGLCVTLCPTLAIEKSDDRYEVNLKKCINCSICSLSCPTDAWKAVKKGYILWLGGTMGKTPLLAKRFDNIIESEEHLYKIIAKTIDYYRNNGMKKERFGKMIERIGHEKVIAEIVDE